MGINLLEPVIYKATNMDAIAFFTICNGSACAFTARSPDKDTPNEDSLALIPCNESAGILVVADGLGGMRNGDKASRDVVNKLALSVKQNSDSCETLRETILDGIEKANDTIISAAHGAASTVALVEIQGYEIRPYHVGDSAILITGQRGKVKHLSIPHSPVGYAVESGMLEAEEAIHHEDRHFISNAVGIAPMHIEIGPKIKLAKRDTVLIASDGLFDNLQIDEIVEIIRHGNLENSSEQLISACQNRMKNFETDQPHHPDDMSFILFRPLS